ncbi:hypothetical protein HO133_002361 [Letharia lupina]|uniref:Uncharacterized protein n=1 Tax=Letharia lupina TaxID=560253 RepID=A0A8H6CDA7_9LECA|nr:uncharacterized protein HO133_002361 [Letharia lupina]KAF6221505.1 hypothetical protein HO133_002361 [Letharia lupina]
MITGYNLQTKEWQKTKELAQALITNQLAAEKSTDLILGKGNGLTILPHGGPGTGKTFTAERKCSSLGFPARPGIQRWHPHPAPPTVSALSTRRFKSRIQLALRYENLTVAQQKKIWRNFLARLRSLDASSIEFDDVMDNVDELVKEDTNGCQIRNAIITAR